MSEDFGYGGSVIWKASSAQAWYYRTAPLLLALDRSRRTHEMNLSLRYGDLPLTSRRFARCQGCGHAMDRKLRKRTRDKTWSSVSPK